MVAMMRIRWLLCAISFVLCGCSASSNFKAARAATEEFHRRMDAGGYGPIYDNSDERFHTVSRDALIGFLTRVNRKMGTCGEAKLSFGGYQVNPSGTFVTVNASRSCANGTLAERFVWAQKPDGSWLVGYNASNPLLLTD